MGATWRLLVDGPVEGAENMARDRAVQYAVERGAAPPTLRLYRWLTPTVTLGRFQPVDGVDLAVCRSRGVAVVRRYTGGRGVLHADELTYSVVASQADGVPRGVAASYRYLCAPLVEAYRLLGVDAELTRHDRRSTASSACYLATTRADVSLGEAKLSGSAQVWHGSTVLQHGSFVVSRDLDLESAVFRLTPEQASMLERDAVTMVDVAGTVPSFEQISSAVITGFERSLGITFVEGGLSQEEVEVAETLKREVRVLGPE